MEPMVVKPRKSLRIIWLIHWALWFIPGLLLGVVLSLIPPYPRNLVAAVFLAVFLVVSLLILFWILAYYRSIEWIVDKDAIKAKKGIFWRVRIEVPYAKICNVDMTQGPLQRMFDVGKINIYTAGGGSAQGAQAELQVNGIKEPEALKDIIMEKVMEVTLSKPEGNPIEATENDSGRLLEQILAELTKIRQAIENKRS
jgi:membrane protein YdbS with pleckstrin-like domain